MKDILWHTVVSIMHLGTLIITWIAAPFLALSAWFGAHVTANPPLPPTGSVACTMEALACPDGSYVGRVPPSCNFAPCPAATSTEPSPKPTPTTGLHVSSLSPASGQVGTHVVVHGSDFTGDNTVHFGYGAVVHVAAQNSTTLAFDVPEVLNPACYYSNPRCLIASRETVPGKYEVSVQNAAGTSNTMVFVVTGAQTTAAPNLYRISPASGEVGATISITGFGFTSENTVLMDGLVAARGVPISSQIAIACTTDPSCHGGINQTIQFAIPESLSPNCPPGSMCPMFLRQVTPGSYTITVLNANGTSNQLTLTVQGSGAGTISINGLDAPTTLALGVQGSWTVHVSAPDSGGQLHYSVVWGDEASGAASIMAPQPTNVQTSATFTHAYQRSGTYTATFTVSNDAGQSASVSTIVLVTPLY